MQYNRPYVAIIHPSETITALTFATYLADDTTETTAVMWLPWASTDSPLTHSRWHDSMNKRCQSMTSWSWCKVGSTFVCKAFRNQLQKNIVNANIDWRIMMHYRDAVFKSRVGIFSEKRCIFILLQWKLQYSVKSRIMKYLEADTEICLNAMRHYCDLIHLWHFRNERINSLRVINQKIDKFSEHFVAYELVF